ncbi:MAG: hypothetical protein AB1816_04265 [Bacillota bacterium]
MGVPGGYVGRLVRVDLTSRQVHEVPVPESVLRRFIGGSGWALGFFARR